MSLSISLSTFLFFPQHKVGMKYGLKLATPEPFYAESHRTSHFQNFAQSEDVDETAVDREDLFT